MTVKQKNVGNGIGIGAALGVAFGTAYGAIFDLIQRMIKNHQYMPIQLIKSYSLQEMMFI